MKKSLSALRRLEGALSPQQRARLFIHHLGAGRLLDAARIPRDLGMDKELQDLMRPLWWWLSQFLGHGQHLIASLAALLRAPRASRARKHHEQRYQDAEQHMDALVGVLEDYCKQSGLDPPSVKRLLIVGADWVPAARGTLPSHVETYRETVERQLARQVGEQSDGLQDAPLSREELEAITRECLAAFPELQAYWRTTGAPAAPQPVLDGTVTDGAEVRSASDGHPEESEKRKGPGLP